MKINLGIADRIIRILLAGVIAFLFFTKLLTVIGGILAIILAGIFLLTSLISFCPLYSLFGFNTIRHN